MTIYVIGADGQVGKRLVKYGAFPISVDIRQKSQVVDALSGLHKSDIVTVLAAVTNVDECENTDNTKVVYETNFVGVKNVADACEEIGCSVAFLSSDHVFNGLTGNYVENAVTKPVNYYGLTKAAAESLAVAYDRFKIVRTSTLFQLGMPRIDDILADASAGISVSIPNFYYRSFMYLPHFVESFWRYLQDFNRMPKVLHLSGSLSVSWYKFAQSLVVEFGFDESLVQLRDFEISGHAPRPQRAGLNCYRSERLGFRQYSYLDGIKEMFDEYNN
jgi:dTDP-4-dehydrorhamnose reductase